MSAMYQLFQAPSTLIHVEVYHVSKDVVLEADLRLAPPDQLSRASENLLSLLLSQMK